MIDQKTPQNLIEKSFGKGWEYFMDLTASNCEVFVKRSLEKDNFGEIIPNKVLYCFYDGEKKGVITEKPWEKNGDCI